MTRFSNNFSCGAVLVLRFERRKVSVIVKDFDVCHKLLFIFPRKLVSLSAFGNAYDGVFDCSKRLVFLRRARLFFVLERLKKLGLF